MAAITYKCPNCDGPLTWNGNKAKFACEYCGSLFAEAELKALNPAEAKSEEIDSDINGQGGDANQEEDSNHSPAVGQGTQTGAASEAETAHKAAGVRMKLYICPSCGAQVTADDTTAATSCYYCHNPIVLSDRLSEEFTPDYIIPFSVDKKKAEEIFTGWVRSRRFVPKDFYNKKQIELLSGVYFPYWVYECTLHTDVSAKGTKIRTWDALGMRHTETSVYDISNSGDAPIRNMSRIALKKASKVLCESVMPFNRDGMKPFQAGYLQGYIAEIRDISKDEIRPEIADELKSYADSEVRNRLGAGYSKVDVESLRLEARNEQYKYALMPVWTVTYKAKDGRIYYFSVNGQTGKTCGELPVDNSRLIKCFLAVFIPVFAVLLAIFRFVL